MPSRIRKALGPGFLCLIVSGVSGGITDPPSRHHKPDRVVIEGFQFRPAYDTIRVGEAVIWNNRDIVPHTATSDIRRFDSKAIAANGSWRFVAKKKGRLSYSCKFHPLMKGVIVVR